MTIRWTEEAAAALEQITMYIADENVDAAIQAANSIYERIEGLRVLPNRGRKGREEGTLELVLAPLPYIVAYRVLESTIEVLNISHGAQDVPN